MKMRYSERPRGEGVGQAPAWESAGAMIPAEIGAASALRHYNILADSMTDIMRQSGLARIRLGHRINKRPGETACLVAMDLTPDGRGLVLGGYDFSARSFDLTTGRRMHRFTGHGGWVSSLSVSGDSRLLATGSHDNTAKLWDMAGGALIRTFTGHTDVVHAVRLDHNGSRLITGGRDQSVRLWDTASGKCLKAATRHSNWVRCIFANADFSRIASSCEGGVVNLWTLSGEGDLHWTRTIPAHKALIYSVFLSQDESLLATGSADQTARLWETASGRCIMTFEGHEDGIRFLCLTPDNTKLLSGSLDRTARLWDTKTGRLLTTYQGGHRDWIRSVGFYKDGTRVLTCSKDGTVCFWDTASGELLGRLHNTEDGFLWSTPSAKGAESGWIWTDHPELVTVYQHDGHGSACDMDTGALHGRELDAHDPEHHHYLAVYNNWKPIKGIINGTGNTGNVQTTDHFFGLVKKQKTIIELSEAFGIAPCLPAPEVVLGSKYKCDGNP